VAITHDKHKRITLADDFVIKLYIPGAGKRHGNLLYVDQP
jgi:hypothetical protein